MASPQSLAASNPDKREQLHQISEQSCCFQILSREDQTSEASNYETSATYTSEKGSTFHQQVIQSDQRKSAYE